MNRLVYTLLAFVAGGVFGWVGDAGHVASGVLAYPPKDHFWPPGLAWWVVPQFAMGGVMLSTVVRIAMARYLRANPNGGIGPCPSLVASALLFIVALGNYVLSSWLSIQFGARSSTVSLILLGVLVLIQVALSLSSPQPGSTFLTLLKWAPLIGLGGVAYESSLSATGAFWYVNPDLGYVNHFIAQLWIGAVWTAVPAMWRYEYAQQAPKAKANKVPGTLSGKPSRATLTRSQKAE